MTNEEPKVTVTLAQRQKIGGRWHDAGEKVEVYQQEAYGMTLRHVLEPGTGVDVGYVNEEAATDLDRAAQIKNRAKIDKAHARGVEEALGDTSKPSRANKEGKQG